MSIERAPSILVWFVPCTRIFVAKAVYTWGAYHLTGNFGNSGWMVNGTVTFWKFKPKIEEYVLRKSVHSSYKTKRNVTYHSPISRFQTHSPPFLIQTVTGMWQFCGKLVNRLPLCFRHPNHIFLSNGKHPQC